ncbi:MAG: DUF1848 domain-containing protein [Calditrichales bacterium]|nr:DUF1848 domain-containing protein [Calditrichales bacterium]
MKTVISASRRTDIPAFYLNRFIDAVKKGSVEVCNPLYRKNKRLIQLTPDAVAWIVFWSRNFRHLLKQKDFFSDYQLYFHFTIIPQSKLEKSAVPLSESLKQMESLCRLYGAERIVWRYDPIVYWYENEVLTSNHDPAKFEFLCREISQLGVKRCYLSFAHPYTKFQNRFKKKFPNDRLLLLKPEMQLNTINEISTIAAHFDISIYSCCNDDLLKISSIKKGRCIDGGLLNKLDLSQRVTEAKDPTRKDCGCTRSIDVGDYQAQPCFYGCIYCYANPVWK